MYKPVSLSLSIVFGIVGLLFLFLPEGVLIFFNNMALQMGMKESPVHGASLYVILAVGYMYLVTLLAFLMYRNPDNRYFSWLLIQGKTASSVISLVLFILCQPFLIFLVNGITDGLIAAAIFFLRSKTRGQQE